MAEDQTLLEKSKYVKDYKQINEFATSDPITLRERPDLEQNPPSDPEQITKEYKIWDWHNLTGTEFEVRQKDYNIQKSRGNTGKALSNLSNYRVENIIHYFGKTANTDPSQNLDLPVNDDFPEACKLPEYLVLNICVPHYEPGFVRNETVGPTTMLLAICKISDECVKRWVDGTPNEADKLLRRFLYNPTPPEGNYNVRRRLKCVVKMANMGCEAIKFGYLLDGIVKKYNGTPFLLRESTSFVTGPNYMVVSVDANLFGRLAKNSLWQCRPFTVHAVCDVCMIIEGDGDLNDELPENVVIALRMAKAPFFPDLDA